MTEGWYPFENQAFRDCWWRHLAPKLSVVSHQNGFVVHQRCLKGRLALRELHLPGWNAAWTQDLTAEKIAALRDCQAELRWDYFRMRWRESREAHQAFDRLKWLGLAPVHIPEPTPGYLIDLAGGFEGYLQGVSSATRKDIRRKLKNADSLGMELRRFEGAAGIEDFFRRFFGHHIAYWEAKQGHSYFNDPHERDFMVAWARHLAQSGRLLLEGLYLEGELANLTMGILDGPTLYSLITINTGAHEKLAPGLLSLYCRMRDADAYGIRLIDMGDGEHGYKARLANRQDPYYALVFANPASMRGQGYVAWLKGCMQAAERLRSAASLWTQPGLMTPTGRPFMHLELAMPGITPVLELLSPL